MTIPTVYPSALPANTVRAYKGAQLIDTRTYEVYDSENRCPTKARVTLSKGKASLGYHNDYERAETWWTELAVKGPRGWRIFGRRFTGPKAERKARADYLESVTTWEQATA